MRQPPRVELGPRLEGLDAAGLALEVLVGAVEEEGDKGADLVAQGGLGGREGGLRDQFVVLCPVACVSSCFGFVCVRDGVVCGRLGKETYADGLEDGGEAGKVLHAGAEGGDGGLKEGERGTQRGDAVGVRRGARGGHGSWVLLESLGRGVGVVVLVVTLVRVEDCKTICNRS